MVWLIQYLPTNDRSPDADVPEGNWKRLGRHGEHLELEDYTSDGGGGLQFGLFELESGRRVKSEGVPRIVRWKSRRQPLDFEWVIFRTVSDRLRAAIEEIEPGVHQFEAIQFISINGDELGSRWFWQICNRLDTMHREKTDKILDGSGWRWNKDIPKTERVGTVFDLGRIAGAGFWYDKYMSGGPFCSDEAKDRIVEGGFSGFKFVPLQYA